MFIIVVGGGVEAAPPQFTAITPSSGYVKVGEPSSFTLTFSDAEGANDLVFVQMLIHTTLNGEGACYVAFDRATNKVILDDGWLDPQTNQVASNSRCTLFAAGSSIQRNGNYLTITWSVSFASTFAGPKTVWVLGYDGVTLAGWYAVGSLIIDRQPVFLSLTPNTGYFAAQTFSVVIGDPDGFQDIAFVQILINSSLTGTGACYISYDRGSNTFSTSTVGCTLYPAMSYATASGLTLTVNFAVQFTSGFDGIKNVYTLAADYANWWAGWNLSGTYQVPHFTPVSRLANQVPLGINQISAHRLSW